jgi:hypothetical protein
MMSLKELIKKDFESGKVEVDKVIARNAKIDAAIAGLDSFNPEDANYKVDLHSCWHSEGEKNTTTNYKGSLCNAIKKAEEHFKKVNRRGDVQARYYVEVIIDGIGIEIPKKYWSRYEERH